MFLGAPSAEYKSSYLAAIEEFRAERFEEGKKLQEVRGDFDAFLRRLEDEAAGRNLPENYVPQTTFWLMDKDEYIGSTHVRHTLNDKLRQVGGHIGYAIRPSKRRMGYGKKILELVLPKAKDLGIEHALLTCDASNMGSKKIIEAAGGKFEDEVVGDNDPKRRYWIDLN